MPVRQLSTRQRLIDAALELFTSQGITETTTRQIAELAAVNEVTLFRHFGSKHRLLLAVLQNSAIFTDLGESLDEQAKTVNSFHQILQDCANARLEALEHIPEFIRSLVGEAGQYPVENRQALGEGLTQANRFTAEYLATAIQREQLQTYLPVEKIASLLNGLLLGYAVIELTSHNHELWHDRNEFLESLVTLFLHGAVSQAESTARVSTLETIPTKPAVIAEKVADLPAPLVHTILDKARKAGRQDYALAYVLFGTGLSPAEVAQLQRSHQITDTHQHLLRVAHDLGRLVPVNQWILGKRYGSYTRNPLTQWLKNRKDNQVAMFLNNTGEPISEQEIRLHWQSLTEELLTPDGYPPQIEQAQHTWCVEMLMRGLSIEDLSILTDQPSNQLQSYLQRAKEKLALEQAIRLDQQK